MWGKSSIGKYLIISIIILAVGIPAAYAITITLGADPILVLGILDMMSNRIINVGTPTLDSDAATKAYVDNSAIALFSCDGAGSSCVVGLGECQNSGINVCVMGSTQCSVSAGASSPEICDGLDNDCDGVIDNNAANASCIDDGLFCTGPELCQSGVCVSSGDPCAGDVGDNDTDCSESCDELASSCTANDPVLSFCSLGFCDGAGTCLASVCGNGIVEPFEQCDDGNQIDTGDDCSNSCTLF